MFKNILRLRTFKGVKLLQFQVIRRQLFSPSPLGLLEFDTQQQILRQKIAHRKGDFLKRLQVYMDDGKKILTEDITTLLYLADNDDEFNFALEVIARYKELQEKQSFHTYFPVGIHALQMLYLHGKHDMAFKWFLDEKYNVETSCRNRQCFMIMMDLLYEHGRFEDVVSLLTAADNYLDRKYPELTNLVLASLYRMNTRESLEKMMTFLNELCLDPVQLTNRCALLSVMLAYKQDEVELMLEILQLPIFHVCSKKFISTIPNMKILAYIELGRVEEAVDILKDAVVKYKKPVPLFFQEVLDKLDSAVTKSGNLELQSLCQSMFRTFKVAGFVLPTHIDDYMLGVIKYKEYEMLLNINRHMTVYSGIKSFSSRLAMKDTKLIT
ncbi:uncharacterized protein LOC123566580 [Mercenaria mercenaria]|uniref:uncharacterized protein LOC123566580 n=1 Tax=Mercenaria mercenaria TaxID=6596 RepID=UPI00234F67D8|nr:uncharacterized protein LOC123566580 [Mercenaria mercenaria]